MSPFKRQAGQQLILIIILFLYAIPSWSVKSPKELSSAPWNVSIQAGTGFILSEVAPGFHFLSNEFTHTPGLSVDLGISRLLTNRWELGANLSLNQFRGNSPLPEFSANEYHRIFFNLQPLPVAYQTESGSLLGSVRYYFVERTNDPLTSFRIYPYGKLGVGMNLFKSELTYSELPPDGTDPSIFAKGQGRYPMPGSSAQYTVGTGALIEFNHSFQLMLSLDVDAINSDCLDMVHNYNEEGESDEAFALIPRLILGAVIPLGGNFGARKSYMPWAP